MCIRDRAQIEALRARLAAEGLFADARKKPLPFLPRTIGLICGRNAKAKDDVVVNASDRWPSARFEIREVAVLSLIHISMEWSGVFPSCARSLRARVVRFAQCSTSGTS